MKQLFILFVFLLIHTPGLAQFYPTQYRPPAQDWQQLQTPHFTFVFPAGEDSVAWRTARMLEYEYGEIQDLADGSLSNFPVILNNYNDRSNGFITPQHFRSEIEIPPLKGKALNPQSGSWMEAVAPHELVHALHFSNTGGFGFGGLVSIFSPDLARSLHGAIPLGITEGLATYHETASIAPNGGRGNHPYFYNQFNAVLDSDEPWSMGQLAHFPEQTRPFDRHYIGGYEFTAWLQRNYGDQASRDALNFYIDLPFLGYGVALRHATGKWPGELFDEFTQSMENDLEAGANQGKTITLGELPIRYEGAMVRHPVWANDSTLIFYGSFYNARPGFYRYHLRSKSHEPLVVTNSVEDYKFDLSPDGNSFLYASYRSSPVYDRTFKAELVEVDIASGRSERLTTDGRMYAPVYTGNGSEVLALQTFGSSSRLVRYLKEEEIYTNNNPEAIAGMEKHQIIEMDVHPSKPDRWAVVVNKRGIQALWLTGRESIHEDLALQPALSFQQGSVYDVSWHPVEEKLLLTADYSGTMQIYEYDLNTERLRQLTDSRFNAMEASYSPDGNRIAFVIQKANEQLPSVLDRSDFMNEEISPGLWKPSEAKSEFMDRPRLGHQLESREEVWTQSSYNSGLGWLKPRAILPVYEEVGSTDAFEIGATLHSNNLLQNQSYSLRLTGFEERLWYNLTYQNKSFYPGFKAEVFSEPSVRTLRLASEQDTLIFNSLRQERSFAMSIPVRLVMDRNVYLSSFFIEPEIRQSQIRFFETGGGDAISNFANVTISNLFTSFNYRLQQNIRDVQPNTGVTLFGEVEHYLSSSDLTINVAGQTAEGSLNQPTGLRGGLFTYLSPLRRWNQSLRISLLGLTQTDPVFDTQYLVSNGFSETVYPTSRNLMSLGTRYTIPLLHADDGGFLFPLYLSNVYLVAYSNTVADLSDGRLTSQTRSVFGAGIRTRFRLSNLALDIGVGFGYEPARNKTNLFIGDF